MTDSKKLKSTIIGGIAIAAIFLLVKWGVDYTRVPTVDYPGDFEGLLPAKDNRQNLTMEEELRASLSRKGFGETVLLLVTVDWPLSDNTFGDTTERAATLMQFIDTQGDGIVDSATVIVEHYRPRDYAKNMATTISLKDMFVDRTKVEVPAKLINAEIQLLYNAYLSLIRDQMAASP